MAKLINHMKRPVVLDYWDGIIPNTVICKYLYQGYIGYYALFPDLNSKVSYALILDNGLNEIKTDLPNCIDYDELPEILKSFYRVMVLTGNSDIPNNDDEIKNLIKLLGENWKHKLKKILRKFPTLESCIMFKPNKDILIAVSSSYLENIKRLANGKIITKYINGKTNCVATFKNGKIIGSYKQYDRVTGKCTMTKTIKKESEC